jgi:hypothetical protein
MTRPEDVLKLDADEDGVGGDDAADALGYLVAARLRTVSQSKVGGREYPTGPDSGLEVFGEFH